LMDEDKLVVEEFEQFYLMSVKLKDFLNLLKF
jgi:hypothetical protein